MRCAADLPRLRFGMAFGTICADESMRTVLPKLLE